VTDFFSILIRWTRARDFDVWAIMNETKRSSLAIWAPVSCRGLKFAATTATEKHKLAKERFAQITGKLDLFSC
jgi:hypothetical protein